MIKVEIYSKFLCPYCYAAKRLFKRKKVLCEIIRVDKNKDRHAEMIERTGRTVVPQIFINGDHIGSLHNITELERRGQLDRLLL